MLRRIQSLGRPQRILIFILLFGGGLLLLIAFALFLVLQAVNSTPRVQARPLMEGITVREFAVLPDDNAYPASLALNIDGIIYTASYVTGTIWAVDATGNVVEMPNTREELVSVVGMTIAPDGSLLVIDRMTDNPSAGGGIVKRVTLEGEINDFAGAEANFVAPDGIAVDSAGYIYVTDRARNQVWRFNSDGSSGTVWWQAKSAAGVQTPAPTGLAYDVTTNTLLITDSEANAIYRVSVDTAGAETIYQYQASSGEPAPGFDGITVTPTGEIYVVLLGRNRVSQLQNGELLPLAEGFRGVSDIAAAPQPDDSLLIYATNWDQSSLIASNFLQPRLPFALDVITVSPPTA